jgi:hypothetical protein
MTNKALKAELLKKLNVTQQRLSQRVQAVIRQVPMSTEDATYCIAHKAGLRLDKFLDDEVVSRVRELVSALRPGGETRDQRITTTKTVTRIREVHVGRSFSIADPILPAKMLAEAKEMAEKVYPVLYIFENSVREVIRRILSSQIGPDWWDRCASEAVRRTVAERVRQEKDIPWHGARGAHPIFYTDIKDLLSIVRNNDAWQKLKPVLGTVEWFGQLISCISASRNPVAHMNPISAHDRQRVALNFRDWECVVKARRSLIPAS